MHNYYLYLVLKQRTFWCIVKQHIKMRVKSQDIDLHTLSVLKQHTCFYSASTITPENIERVRLAIEEDRRLTVWELESDLRISKIFVSRILHGENFMAIFTTLSVVIRFSTGTLGIFATLVYVFNMRVVIYEILSMAIITTLSTSILFYNLYYILL